METFDFLLGKTLEEAKHFLNCNNFTYGCWYDVFIYPTKIDDHLLFITSDVNLKRLTVDIENNIIVKVNGLG